MEHCLSKTILKSSLGSSTIKDLGLSTVTSSTDITQQLSDEVTSASVTTT